MPCNVGLNINPPIIPPISGDFGIPISPIQLPFPDINIPTDLMSDLMDLVNKLQALFPSSVFKPNIDEFTKTILDGISNLFSQIAPFLSFYNFIMAALNLIICIIEVLCAIPNPWKIAAAMERLFSQCIPAFLLLFPWLALIAMILALILLLIALIEYIILFIIAIIEEIIRNIMVLANGVTLQDAESVIAATQKIADLLCSIQSILAILTAVAAIIAIIEALAMFGGGSICDDNSLSGCCGEDVCPPFIKDSPLTGMFGVIQYYNEIKPDLRAFDGFPIAGVPALRNESWQVYSILPSDQGYKFSAIIDPVAMTNIFPPEYTTFWPEGMSFDMETPNSRIPYSMDLTFLANPAVFGHDDTGGARYFKVKNCKIISRPYRGVYSFDNSKSDINQSGTLNVIGGLVYEADDSKYMLNGEQATIQTFLHKSPDTLPGLPAVDDGITLLNVQYTLYPNHKALMLYNVITAGCLPSVRAEKSIQNTLIEGLDPRPPFIKLPFTSPGEKVASTGPLPNVAGAQKCALDALSAFQKNVSLETAAQFQAEITTCLNDLKNQALSTYCNGFLAAVNQYTSGMELNTDAEFTTRPIKVAVTLRDATKVNIGTNIPANCIDGILDKLNGEVTLGSITDFTYDGYSVFNAEISSEQPGSGELTVAFDGKIFSNIIAGDVGVTTKIEENVLTYTFIESVTDAAIRRDVSDVADNGA